MADVTLAHPLPIDGYMCDLDALVAAHDCIAQDRVTPAIAAERAPREVVQRVALETYHVARWIAPELALLIAHAPDAHSFTMEDSLHYREWARRLAGDAGYLGAPGRVRAALERCRQLGLSDDDVGSYMPLPETIATTCTLLFYVRRSYEEGLAGLYAAMPDEETRRSDTVGALLRLVATTGPVQERCREAVRNVVLTAECRVRAMNRWVE